MGLRGGFAFFSLPGLRGAFCLLEVFTFDADLGCWYSERARSEEMAGPLPAKLPRINTNVTPRMRVFMFTEFENKDSI